MDNRNAKRPRTPTKGGEPPLKKKSRTSKKSKKSKRSRANSEGELKKSASSLHSTATAEGLMMAQMLSTFSKMEQSRFEAFRRSTVPANAVEEWVAACLADRYRIPVAKGDDSRTLADLVQPGQAGPISMVVATLAKVYAQRLVSAAINHAQEDANKTAETTATAATAPYAYNTYSNNNGSGEQQQSPLQPRHLWQALENRSKQGLDPGFFLQANAGLQWNSISGAHASHDCKRLAALAAQEEYDAHMAKEALKEKEAVKDEMDVDAVDMAAGNPEAGASTMG